MKYHRRHSRWRQFDRCKRQYNSLKDRFTSIATHRGIYRSRNGIFMGVCRGLAEHFDFSVFWTRVVALLFFLFTGFWPAGVLYIIAGLLLKVEPVSPLKSDRDYEFYETYTTSRQSAVHRIKRKFDNLNRRIQRMEHTVTSREFDWK